MEHGGAEGAAEGAVVAGREHVAPSTRDHLDPVPCLGGSTTFPRDTRADGEFFPPWLRRVGRWRCGAGASAFALAGPSGALAPARRGDGGLVELARVSPTFTTSPSLLRRL